MAYIEHTEIFDIEIEKFYKTIIDYAAYPKFLDGVSSVEILSQTDEKAQVEYSVNLIKTFKYVVDLKQKSPTLVSWKLKSGDLFKSNTGSWKLKELKDGKTQVTYTLDVEFKGFIPDALVNKVVASNVPQMLKSYFKRAKKQK